MLSALLWTEAPTREDQDEGIAFLQFRERAVRATVIRKRAVGENDARHNVRSHGTSLSERLTPLSARSATPTVVKIAKTLRYTSTVSFSNDYTPARSGESTGRWYWAAWHWHALTAKSGIGAIPSSNGMRSSAVFQ